MMEPNKDDFSEIQNEKNYIFYSVILVLILVIGAIAATYAYFQVSLNNSASKTDISVQTGCISIKFNEVTSSGNGDKITLPYNYPISDTWALANIKPIEVQVINECAKDDVQYTLTLTTLAKNTSAEVEGEKYLEDSKVRYNVKRATGVETSDTIASPTTDFRTTSYLDDLQKMEQSGSNYKILKEELAKKEEPINLDEYDTVNTYVIDSTTVTTGKANTYSIYLWIDYYEGDKNAYKGTAHTSDNYDNSTENTKFSAIVSLISNVTEEINGTVADVEG